MRQLQRCRASFIALAVLLGMTSAAKADIFQGTLYYTHYTGGGPNVLSVAFTYNDGTKTVAYGPQTGLATLNGADGIMFAPNGNLLVTSNTTNAVYRLSA